MTVAFTDGTICLLKDCILDEAESLLQLLLDHPDAAIDWSGCTGMHSAVLQVAMAGRRRMVGQPADDFLRRWVGPALAAPAEGPAIRPEKNDQSVVSI
ncbi:hypothetical protein [Niveispirillum sp.]|uniref:hypothetical protein n=1 Tax=Niveispirillum sp. TaxID=1917217 RepID=UPI001B51DDAB|nr:hypothetical protein [Niveispirillum sp.]MBP7339299.1 hypothetical protein [Niveispirillum sp.]